MSIFLYNKNMPPFYESTCSLDELDEKPNHLKISKFWNFERKGYKAKDSFKNPFDKKIMFNVFEMSSFRCKSHV
jgi:predicted nucleotide-binding protein (sugar kinase/HSP70/actin superfamily)